MSEPRCALRARELRVLRGSRTVLDSISFEAPAGSVLSVLGPNGAGKSTLLRALSGLLPYAGSVELQGSEARDLARLDMARRVAFVPQRSMLASQLRVHAVVAQGRYAHHPGLQHMREADARAVSHALQVTRTEALAERVFTELSYGEQRRVLLARALATGARILLLDEPTASLDIQHSLSLFALLRTLAAAGTSVVVVLHQLDEARRFADRALLLHHGRCIAHGPVAQVISPEHIAAVYGVRLLERDGLGFELADPASA